VTLTPGEATITNVNSQDLPTETWVQPAVERPAARWNGTAAQLRRSRPPSLSVRDQRWSLAEQAPIDWDELDRRHAGRYEPEPSPGGYRASQWSDRDEAVYPVERSGPYPGTLPSSRGAAGPVALRAPRSPDAADAFGPEPAAALPDGLDPTPLFTATEYVAVGDSPLYQFVAEFIATGDRLLAQEVPPSVLDEPLPAPGPARSGGRHQDGWRVAGHRSGTESSRRSSGRTPRHRAA
jgi:hypothetical protein